MKSPQRPLLASSTVHFAGDGRGRRGRPHHRRGPRRRGPGRRRLRRRSPVLDMEAALADGATLVHPDLGTNENATWVFDSGAAGTGGDVGEAIAAAEADPTRSWSSAASASSG